MTEASAFLTYGGGSSPGLRFLRASPRRGPQHYPARPDSNFDFTLKTLPIFVRLGGSIAATKFLQHRRRH